MPVFIGPRMHQVGGSLSLFATSTTMSKIPANLDHYGQIGQSIIMTPHCKVDVATQEHYNEQKLAFMGTNGK